MNTMVDQPSLSSVQKAIEAHLAPSVHLQSLPRALELLAHIALIANKLSDEITRILESNSCHHSGSDHLRLSDKVVERVRSCRADAEKASKRLWQFSVDLRLNHIAAVLSPGKKVSIKILYLIECYFPSPQVSEGPSSSKKTYKSSKLFIRAMPDHIVTEYDQAGLVSREWYDSAVTSSILPEDQARALELERENGAVLAKQALAYTSRVIEYTGKVERILESDTGAPSVERPIKQEIKEEARGSRSPFPNQSSRDPQLTSNPHKRLSSNVSVTRSVTPKVQRLGSERTTSLAETEAILTIPKGEVPSSDQPKITEPRRTSLAAESKPVLSTKPKKRPRPSFPPREGPDYTRPLPHTSTKKLRIFGTGDLKP